MRYEKSKEESSILKKMEEEMKKCLEDGKIWNAAMIANNMITLRESGMWEGVDWALVEKLARKVKGVIVKA